MTMQYNARNLPVWRIEPGGISGQGIDAAKAMSYAYNADGLRISKDVTEDNVTATTKLLYESGYITLELDGSGNQTAYNVY